MSTQTKARAIQRAHLEPYQRALQWVRQHGQEIAEVARETGLSPTTAAVRLFESYKHMGLLRKERGG